MPIEVRLFPCLSDNYGFLVRDTSTGDAAAVDTPDGPAVLRELEASGWRLSLILNTHWHPDHTQATPRSRPPPAPRSSVPQRCAAPRRSIAR